MMSGGYDMRDDTGDYVDVDDEEVGSEYDEVAGDGCCFNYVDGDDDDDCGSDDTVWVMTVVMMVSRLMVMTGMVLP